MSTKVTLPETMLVRRLYTSNTPHLIDTTAPRHPDHKESPSLCGVRPIWPGIWIDPGSEFLGSVCGTCITVLEATQSVTDA